MNFDCTKSRSRGFTLIELLVVIAIIALLLAILMPSLQAAKRHAFAVICLNNQKQIGMAANLYSNDYNGLVPRGDANLTLVWFTCFLPYIGQDANITDYRQVKVYRCKAFPRSGSGIDDVKNSRQTIGYVVNAWEFNGSNDLVGHETSVPTKTTKFRMSSSTAYLADNEAGEWRPVLEDISNPDRGRFDFFQSSHLPTSDVESGPGEGRRIARDRHGDGCNLLFLDWHAEQVKAEDITAKTFRER
jgi:prepilin-type N-terminal cleavage/methylation domain-containing protein/prepilin-type processing-associated H-X9-DG protein